MHRDSPPILICPAQVEQHRVARALVQQWCERGLFDAAHFVDLSQSMSAGGGPACLRLRVPLPSGAVAALASPPLWSPQLDQQLRLVIDECYASRLSLSDLADADFHAGARQARERIAEVLAPIGDAS
jgi:succinylarginine dihydrolase